MKETQYFSSPVLALPKRVSRDTILGTVADLVISEGFADIGLNAFLERFAFERLAVSGQVSEDELAFFYRDPKRLLYGLFDAMLAHLEVCIARMVEMDTESMGRFERAYRAVVSGKTTMAPVTVSGLDGVLANRLFFLFMSVMDHEIRHGTSMLLQQRWMAWYSGQIVRHDRWSVGY